MTAYQKVIRTAFMRVGTQDGNGAPGPVAANFDINQFLNSALKNLHFKSKPSDRNRQPTFRNPPARNHQATSLIACLLYYAIATYAAL
jgi:hypothetical protein